MKNARMFLLGIAAVLGTQEVLGSNYNSYGNPSYGSTYGQQSSIPYGYDQKNIDQQAQNLKKDICQKIIDKMNDIADDKRGNIESYKNIFDDLKSSFRYQNQNIPGINPSQIVDDLWNKVSYQSKNLPTKNYMMKLIYGSLTSDEQKEAESGLYDINNDSALWDFMRQNTQVEIPRGRFLVGVLRVLWNTNSSQQDSSSENPRDGVIQSLKIIMQKVPTQHPLYSRLQAICEVCSGKASWIMKHYFQYALGILAVNQDLPPLKNFGPVTEVKEWVKKHENIKSSPYIPFKPEDKKDPKQEDPLKKGLNQLKSQALAQGTKAVTDGLSKFLSSLGK